MTNDASPGRSTVIIRTVIVSFTAAALCAAFVSPARAAGDFVGPPDWRSTDVQSPVATRKVQQWHMAGAPSMSLTLVDDSTQAFTDAVGVIQKNFSDNNIRPGVDREMPCRGVKAHVFEFETGPDESKIAINRLIVPNGAGVTMITYTRVANTEFDPEVKKSEADYCTSGVASAPAAASAASTSSTTAAAPAPQPSK